MNVQAAAISLAGRQFVVILVSLDLVKSPGEADMAIERLQATFGSTPIVLLAQAEDGSPNYYGDRDLLELLWGVPVEQMPWQEIRVRS